MKELLRASRPASHQSPAGASPTSTVPIDLLIQLRRRFLAFIRARVSDAETAEDILQMAYLRALSTRSGLQADESAVAWFYRILRNAIIDLYRSRGAETAALERWASELGETRTDTDLQDTVCRCIEAALAALIPGYARVLREVERGNQESPKGLELHEPLESAETALDNAFQVKNPDSVSDGKMLLHQVEGLCWTPG